MKTIEDVLEKVQQAHDEADQAMEIANYVSGYEVAGDRERRAAEAMAYVARSIAYSVQAAAMLTETSNNRQPCVNSVENVSGLGGDGSQNKPASPNNSGGCAGIDS